MSRSRIVIALVGISFVVASGSAFAVSKRTAGAAAADVRQLVRMMDKDQNGNVSKEEFMQFMGQTFDRMDVNKSGQLEPSELRSMTIPNWLLKFEAGER